MNNQFISINEASKLFDVSSNTIRKIIKSNIDTDNVKTEPIKGKHGFKYVVSIEYLNSIYNNQSIEREPKTDLKNGFKSSNQNNKFDRQNNNQIDRQIDRQIDKLNNQIDKQNQIIDKLTDTINEQNKVIVSQSMQIYQLTSSSSSDTEPPSSNVETLIIVVLVLCIVAVIIYLFR